MPRLVNIRIGVGGLDNPKCPSDHSDHGHPFKTHMRMQSIFPPISIRPDYISLLYGPSRAGVL
jgi:hypothetical protein